jgi:hypothetical protein
MLPFKVLKFLLAFVDNFMSWIEAFPAIIEKASEVTTALLEHIIPHYGLLVTLQSDNGVTFLSQVTQRIYQALQIKVYLHAA